jgi:hypothetical protein
LRFENVYDLRQEIFRQRHDDGFWIEVTFDLDKPRPKEKPDVAGCLECGGPLTGRQKIFCSRACGNRQRQRRHRLAAQWNRMVRALDETGVELVAAVAEPAFKAKLAREERRQAKAQREYLMRVRGGFIASGVQADSDAVDALHETEIAPGFWARSKTSPARPAQRDTIRVHIEDDDARTSEVVEPEEELKKLLALK